ncbi:hypothetical protein ACX0G7_24880 [Flavitalea antarctica]
MPENQIQSNDDISLHSIKVAVSGFARVIYKSFTFIGRSVRHNVLIVISFLLIGALAAGLSYYLAPRSYEAGMLIQYSDLSKKAYGELIKNLSSLALSRSTARLATELKMPESGVANIIRIEAVGIDEKPLESDTSKVLNLPIKIVFFLANDVLHDSLERGMLTYLNSNPYSFATKRSQEAAYIDHLKFIDRELNQLDTLKRNYNEFLGNSKINSTYFINSFDPAKIYQHSNELMVQKQFITNWLNTRNKSVTLIDGLKPPVSTYMLSLKSTIILGVLIGLLLGLLAAFIKELSVDTRLHD